MDLRLSLYQLAAQYTLSPDYSRRLLQLAGFDAVPEAVAKKTATGLAIVAAALGGLGIVMWIAANWNSWGRIGRFSLLQGFVLILCMGALLRPAARKALGLIALLAIGGLFAYFGQTYQAGADSWQLFAVWAALALPLCLGVRSDIVWAPWALVAMTAVSLWAHAHTSYRWRAQPLDANVHLIAWGVALLLTIALSRLLERHTGAGPWALRTSVSLTMMLIVAPALMGLLESQIAPQFWFGLCLMVGAALCFAWRPMFDIFSLSIAALALDVLIFGGIAHAILDGRNVDGDSFLLLGLTAAALLAATVNAIMHVFKKHATQGVQA